MLQDGHAPHVQLPSLGHGGTGSYVGQQDGNTANRATVPPPEQQAGEGIEFLSACKHSHLLVPRRCVKPRPGVNRGNCIHRIDFCGMGYWMFSDTSLLRWRNTVSNTFDRSLFLIFCKFFKNLYMCFRAQKLKVTMNPMWTYPAYQTFDNKFFSCISRSSEWVCGVYGQC